MFIPLKATEGEKLEYHLVEKLLQGFFFCFYTLFKITWKVSSDNFSNFDRSEILKGLQKVFEFLRKKTC